RHQRSGRTSLHAGVAGSSFTVGAVGTEIALERRHQGRDGPIGAGHHTHPAAYAPGNRADGLPALFVHRPADTGIDARRRITVVAPQRNGPSTYAGSERLPSNHLHGAAWADGLTVQDHRPKLFGLGMFDSAS